MIRVPQLCIKLLFIAALFMTCQQSSDQDRDLSSNSPEYQERPIGATDSLVIIVFKKEQMIEFWKWTNQSAQQFAISAFKGPTLAAGPRISDQAEELPEGVYSFLSPDQLAFPNAFDRRKAVADRRIFKKNTFELKNNHHSLYQPISEAVKSVGSSKSSILIVPLDFRKLSSNPSCALCPPWTNELYNNLKMTLEDYSLK